MLIEGDENCRFLYLSRRQEWMYLSIFSATHFCSWSAACSGCRVFRSLVRHGGLRQVDLVLSCLSPEFTKSEWVLGRCFSTLLGKIWGVVRQVPSEPGRLAGREADVGKPGSRYGVQVEAGPSLCGCRVSAPIGTAGSIGIGTGFWTGAAPCLSSFCWRVRSRFLRWLWRR